MPAGAVTFDAGQTLVELDTAMLAARLAERGLDVAAAALDAAWPAAWRHHEAEVGRGARHPWRQLMAALLAGAGVPAAALDATVAWLWDQQATRNLWRRDVPGMRALVADLAAAGVPLAVVSNSEGHLAALLAELGWARWFVAIADSGVLGVAKPDPGIFAWAGARLGVAADAIVHVGDSRAADVVGARAAGLRAIWFGADATPLDDPGVVAARDAAATRAALAAWGLPCGAPGDPGR
ncbi:MAG: HAD-IA family hydrolase [Kofleriaceae bacterium]|nr:HAD-IA family hydrolase [Kofleriaceae bacterium]MCB9571560.1 HAD-IA family hydrolase [Kofleriaceae bacterium]